MNVPKTVAEVFVYAKEKYSAVLEKVLSHNKILNSYMKTLGTFDYKFDSLVQLLEQKGLITQNEFEELNDHNTGWRKKTVEEVIKVGDVVWVDYKMTSKEVKEKVPEGFVQEVGLPVRVGAKAIIFEDSLLGKKLGEVYDYKHEDKEGKDEFDFTITISKVKTPLEGVYHGADSENGDGSLESGNTSEDQSNA